MAKANISKTAQANLYMLANLGIPEAIRFRDALGLDGNPLAPLSFVPFANRLPVCLSTISEILYARGNDLIIEENNPTVLDLACGYSPRVMVMAPRGYTYIGADLPEVANALSERRAQLIPDDPTLFAGYRCIDVSNIQQMEAALGALREPMTIVTQGLITYLSLDQKQQLMEGVKALLSRDGGCWIIPDANPDRMLPETLDAIMGRRGFGVARSVYRIVDKYVGRSREQNGWRNIDEIIAALEEFGFKVKRVPLYRDGLTLWCLGLMPYEEAERLVAMWKTMDSLVVTL